LHESAELLSAELREFRRQHAGRKVAILAHSMGGLIARECVEDPALDPGNVRKLIMIAPPNQGTLLAKVSFGTDLWEHAWGGQGSPMKRFRASVTDGMAEAIEDLEPGSEFLTRLNARDRNPNVRYTILLGTAATMRPRDMKTVRTTMNKTCGRIPFAGNCVKRCDTYLADLDEVLIGKGDGVVAVKRGQLEGVEDTVLLEFGHLSVTGPADRRAIREVHEAVLSRLDPVEE
jgi:pimeloyl-ACP methyl ester carboxylesterase